MYIIFFLMWVIFNGRITLEIIIFGLIIAGLMYAFICKFMDYSVKKDLIFLRKSLAALQYLGVLLKEILKANLATMRFILFSPSKIEPVLVHFKADLKTKTARVILANSITLTPGTITVSLENDEYVVHCLDKSMAEGLENSIFVKLLQKMEKTEEKR